ncbi:MAG: alpha/beta fold hydrolase [Thermoanaerobaculales bacterium]|nr:alpha/beta fold hydrolase [Thermoanaerobaculales bacterium]
MVENSISSLNAWIGDYLSQTGNELQQPMAFYQDNRPVAPEDTAMPPTGKVCVLVHGLGCNESLWSFPAPHDGGGYGELLERRCGYMPLYLRFNTGLRISTNGKQLADLLEQFCANYDAAVTELLLIGHSLGGLVIRSACHLGSEAGQGWVSRVRHVVYLGSPHLGAPLEKTTNVATNVLGLFNTTATRVIRDLLNTRSAGVKDLRFGNLVERDWLDCDPDELMNNRRVTVPWLATAHHHLAVGQALAGMEAFGDAMVWPESAAGRARGSETGAPAGSDVQVMPGLDHLALARDPAVYQHIERWVREDG